MAKMNLEHLNEVSKIVTIGGGVDVHLLVWYRGAEEQESFRLQARNVMFWNHGIGEYGCRNKKMAEKIFEMAPTLDAFVTYDMRGHGVAMDKANACKVDSVDVLVQDLDIVFKACLDQFDSSARFLVAGRGLVVASAVSRKQSIFNNDAKGKICGVVLSGPAISVFVNGRVNQLLAPFAKLVTMVPGTRSITKDNGISAAELTHDESEVSAYIADENIHNRISLGLASDMLSCGDGICAAVERDTEKGLVLNSVPVLLIHGAEDKIVNPAGTSRLASCIQNQASIKLVIVPGARHEVHNELPDLGRNRYFDEVSQHTTKCFSQR